MLRNWIRLEDYAKSKGLTVDAFLAKVPAANLINNAPSLSKSYTYRCDNIRCVEA
jgi:hypothetical protein